MPQKVVLITGASSGIGKAVAKRLISEGYIVYGAARRAENMRDLEEQGGHAIRMDITSEQDVTAAVQRILDENKRIDVLINNAGYAVYGAVEQVSIDRARRQFEVNLFGLATLTQKVIPILREQEIGQIINVSSVAGKVYSPLGAWYHASKHALEGWSDALRTELVQFGIDVTIIEPGAIVTEFSDIMNEPMLELSKGTPYEALSEVVIKNGNRAYDGSPSTRPAVIAKVISKAIKSKKPKTRYVAGKFSKEVLIARRWLSDRAFDKMVMNM